MNKKELEIKSSAVTLSDMEMFIFPELMYSLVLSNIMSPRIWKWREDDWFAGIENMKPRRRITRLKQYIMDHYAFNLDLDTWGLTTKEEELDRFKDFISEETLKQSNALFGYEGDKYYFDIDIRTHFGLDKYEGHIIPYWKTETVEAMDAFKYKPNYTTGAGECVSLATLYAAALFIVARIPLKDIYLMATPLHSQNFIDLSDGILTNNRRLVTKNMWFNGTELSGQARRALENERVTFISHETGWIHTVYDEATIDKGIYDHFRDKLKGFLKIQLSEETLGNFLRNVSGLQKCFQIKHSIHGVDQYIGAERIFAYEHGSPFRLTDNTRDKLLNEIDTEEFRPTPFPDRIMLNDLEAFIKKHRIDLSKPKDVELLNGQFREGCLRREEVVSGLINFCRVTPQLPTEGEKEFSSMKKPLGLDLEMTREEIIEHMEGLRAHNRFADMAFYAYRDLSKTEHEPFMHAAIHRNPVSLEESRNMKEKDIVSAINDMPNESIYDENRLAQPDEVWNYKRGDGLEKAILLANILYNKKPKAEATIVLDSASAILTVGRQKYTFSTAKTLPNQSWVIS